MNDVQGYPITISGLTKTYGPITAIDDLSFTALPGRVTGFLGPNGAGKSTTLRILLGLDFADSGSALIGRRSYRQFADPALVVGAALEADSFHPGRTGRNHLAVYAAAMGVAKSRIGEVLELVGLQDSADREAGGYSLGMRQRLSLATAMLPDPAVLVLDEPANGLDPEGIRWMRELLRNLAAAGRTVLLSSHLLGEIQLIAHDVVIINKGKLVVAGDLAALEDSHENTVLVDSPHRAELERVLLGARLQVTQSEQGFLVHGALPEQVGAAAANGGVALSHLSVPRSGLEESFLELVGETR